MRVTLFYCLLLHVFVVRFFPNPKVDLQSFFKEKVVNSGELFSLSDVVSVALSVKCGPCWELTCSFPQNTKLKIIFLFQRVGAIHVICIYTFPRTLPYIILKTSKNPQTKKIYIYVIYIYNTPSHVKPPAFPTPKLLASAMASASAPPTPNCWRRPRPPVASPLEATPWASAAASPSCDP